MMFYVIYMKARGVLKKVCFGVRIASISKMAAKLIWLLREFTLGMNKPSWVFLILHSIKYICP
jgi:hypothetical protein